MFYVHVLCFVFVVVVVVVVAVFVVVGHRTHRTRRMCISLPFCWFDYFSTSNPDVIALNQVT